MHPGSSAPRGRAVLLAVCLASVILPLNFSGGAIATLAISREFGNASADLAWITNAFMLTFGSSLMLAGALADQFGRRRLFLCGVLALTVFSLTLCLAPDPGMLIALRALQGCAAAAALAGGSASLAQVFEGRALTRAFSALGTSFGTGLAFGPLAGGLLIDAFGWRSVFLAIAGVGVVAIAFGALCMQESRDPDAAGVDWPGALTFTAALACLTIGVLQAPVNGWLALPVLCLLSSSVVFACLFVIVEMRARRPMLDLSLFRYPRFLGAQMLPVGTCYCYIVLLVLLPMQFIGIHGMSERAAGIMMLALSAPMLFMPAVAAWLTRWIAPGPLAALGLLVAAFGLAMASQVVGDTHPAGLMPSMLLIGIGTGLPWGLMDGLAMTVVPPERAGMAAGIFSTTRVAGEGIALAVVLAGLAGLVQASLPHGTGLGVAADAARRAAGMQLASGNVDAASRLFPGLARPDLAGTYMHAFRVLLRLLCAVTVAAAMVTFACLAPRRVRERTCAGPLVPRRH